MTHLWAVFAVFDESQWGAVDISGFALTTESVLYFGTKALHLVAFQVTANSPPQLPKRFIWSAADDGALSEAAVAASQAKDKAVLFDCLLIFQIKKKKKSTFRLCEERQLKRDMKEDEYMSDILQIQI